MTKELFNLEGITRIYKRGSEQIKGVDNLNLKIDKGEYISILGPSGAGKTTFLNMLGCIDSPTSGRLVFYSDSGEAIELTGMKENKLDEFRRENIGFVFADFFLLHSLTATENVELPLIFSNSKKLEDGYSKKVLEMVGLGHRLTHKPLHLSGGEMQRVAVARSIVNQPKVLLADEPTANLDTGNSEVIFNLFEELNNMGMTVVVATHAEELAKRAKRTIFLQDGKIVEDRGGK